jgi:hypothetical protein
MKKVTHFKNTKPQAPVKDIEKIDLNKKKGSKLKVAGIITVSLFSASILATSAYGVASFFNKYELQTPIVIRLPYKEKEIIMPISETEFNKRMEVKETEEEPKKTSFIPKAEAKEAEVTRVKASTPSDYEIAKMIASYDWDYSTAIRIAKSENFWNLTKSFDCKRQGGVNNNGTRDHGLWQINDIHIKSGAITLEDALDCKKATAFAYGLYKGRGNQWTAWSAYNNGSYANHSVIEL